MCTECQHKQIVINQLLEQHDKLVEELATQYRDAEKVGWLPPGSLKKMGKRILDLLNLGKTEAAKAFITKEFKVSTTDQE